MSLVWFDNVFTAKSTSFWVDAPVAKITGLKAKEFVHTFGDLHLYSNHVEQAKKQAGFNNQAANRAYVAEQTKLTEARKKAAFEQQTILDAVSAYYDYVFKLKNQDFNSSNVNLHNLSFSYNVIISNRNISKIKIEEIKDIVSSMFNKKD